MIANGASTTFSAVLKEDGIVAIAGRTITITLGSGSTAQTCNGTTDATGTVSCSILVNQPLGPGTVAASFTGDALYLQSSNSTATILFAFPAQGAFVLGNKTASGAVEFWGDDWATVNILSGGPAPDAFKGFAANTNEPPTCGSAWTTNPGTSSQPPAGTLPSFMGVVVSTKVGQIRIDNLRGRVQDHRGDAECGLRPESGTLGYWYGGGDLLRDGRSNVWFDGWLLGFHRHRRERLLTQLRSKLF